MRVRARVRGRVRVEASCAIRPMEATKWKSHMSSKSSRHE